MSRVLDDFEESIRDDLRREDARKRRRDRERMRRLFSNDEPFSEPDEEDEDDE